MHQDDVYSDDVVLRKPSRFWSLDRESTNQICQDHNMEAGQMRCTIGADGSFDEHAVAQDQPKFTTSAQS